MADEVEAAPVERRRLVGLPILRRDVVALAVLALASVVLLPIAWPDVRAFQINGIPVLVHLADIGVYFRESAWSIGQGSYGSVPSEYPLLANVIFAAARVVAAAWRPAQDPAVAFEITWIAGAWWAWLGGLVLLRGASGRLGVLLWLTPAALYFSLSRFDVYPALATLAALLAVRDGRPRLGGLWLGVAIALKGYALVALPALLVWVALNRGRREAVAVGAVAAAPLLASMAVVLLMAGPSLTLYPFTFQAGRPPNLESTWTAIAWITNDFTLRVVRHAPWLAPLLELAAGVVAAALRPRTVPQLARAFVVAIGGFATFSVFHSPQWFLWYVPAVALSGSLATWLCALALGWVSYVYYPFTYVAAKGTTAFRAAVWAVTLTRIGMTAGALASSLPPGWRVWRHGPRGEPSGAAV